MYRCRYRYKHRTITITVSGAESILAHSTYSCVDIPVFAQVRKFLCLRTVRACTGTSIVCLNFGLGRCQPSVLVIQTLGILFLHRYPLSILR
jgi:hypothetical protein